MSCNPDTATPYSIANAERVLDEAAKDCAAATKSFDLLPKIDAQGNSACTFAEALYRRNEERLWYLRNDRATLNEYVRCAIAEVSRFREEAADDSRSESEREDAAANARRHDILRADLWHMVKKVQRVLQECSSRRFPGMKPWTKNDFNR